MTRLTPLLVGAAAAYAVWSATTADFGPTPYTNPTAWVEQATPDYVDINISFAKSDECVFDRMVVTGEELSVDTPLVWEDLDGAKGVGRDAGVNSADIRVYTPDIAPDRVKVYTRHVCGDDIVDRLFGVVDLIDADTTIEAEALE